MPNDIPNSTWNEVDASNTAPVPNGAPEGWFPSDVNNVYRMGMGATKRFWDHLNATATTAGTSTAFTAAYAVAPQALYAGEIFTLTFNQDCGDAPTLNVNALGGKTIRKFNGSSWVALVAADIKATQVVSLYYNATDLTYDIIAGLRESSFAGGTLTLTTNMSGAAFNEAKGADIVAASTTNIGAADGNYIHITGTTAITAFDTVQAGTERVLEFDDVLVLTYNATSLILPGAANITTAAGDIATFRSEGAGNWRCTNYLRAAVVSATDVLSSDVALNNPANYFPGPTLTLGPGVYDLFGSVTMANPTGADLFYAKLWDSSTVIDSGGASSGSIGWQARISLGGTYTGPGTVLISVRGPNSAAGVMQHDATGNAKDCKLTAIRIA